MAGNAETAFFAELDHSPGQVFIADADPKLAVQRVGRDLPEWIIIDVLDGASQLLAVESVPLISSA